MKIRILVKNSFNEKPWYEEHDKDLDDPVKWAKETIENYNKTLRKYELPLLLLCVESIQITYTKLWEKKDEN